VTARKCCSGWPGRVSGGTLRVIAITRSRLQLPVPDRPITPTRRPSRRPVAPFDNQYAWTVVRVNKALVGEAGEHLVLSRLLQGGFVASQSPRGHKSYDIIIARGPVISVKATQTGPRIGWFVGHPTPSPDLFYALVDFNENPAVVYVVPSDVVSEKVRSEEKARSGAKDSGIRKIGTHYQESWVARRVGSWNTGKLGGGSGRHRRWNDASTTDQPQGALDRSECSSRRLTRLFCAPTVPGRCAQTRRLSPDTCEMIRPWRGCTSSAVPNGSWLSSLSASPWTPSCPTSSPSVVLARSRSHSRPQVLRP